MRWAVLLLLSCSSHVPVDPVNVPGEVRPDPTARAWALRAWVAEARGDATGAERAWRWAARLDPGTWPELHRAWFLVRHGRDDEAITTFTEVFTRDPSSEEARLGLGALTEPEVWLDPLVEQRSCRVATLSKGALRQRAEALCIGL